MFVICLLEMYIKAKNSIFLYLTKSFSDTYGFISISLFLKFLYFYYGTDEEKRNTLMVNNYSYVLGKSDTIGIRLCIKNFILNSKFF